MRTIKLRGKRVDNGEWVEGSLFQFIPTVGSDIHAMIICGGRYSAEIGLIIGRRFEVIPETIGRFTGLTDKNGVEIYEDDLLSNEDKDILRVYSVIGGFAIKANYWMRDCSDLILTDDLIIMPLAELQTSQWVEENTEIIGNIHDSPLQSQK